MQKKFAIGVDIGGTNTRVALVEETGGGRGRTEARVEARVVAQAQMSTKRLKGPAAFVRGITAAVTELLGDSGIARGCVRGVGVGAPGSVDVARGVVHFLPNVPGWKNIPLGAALRRRTGLAVRVDNDANAMAQGEFRYGAARGARNAVFVTLGTGVGGGLLINGELFHGEDFSAAEIGHIRYRPDGARCACGARGCIETELGNSYLLKKIKKDLSSGISSRIGKLAAASEDRKIRLEMADESANNGDRYALGFWRERGAVLGDFLAGIANLLNPQVIVVGGGVAQAGPLLLGPARKRFRDTAFPKAAKARIVSARFGTDAGIIGAAGLVFAK